MIQLTDSAAGAMLSAIAGARGPIAGLRLAVQSGGCAGLKYMMGLVPEAAPEDVVVDAKGVTMFLDPSSLPILAGTTVDFVSSVEGAGFTFDNPNAQAKCSCGKSFG
ncbi:MAG TPA: iron-sulfur cluster assembly accessory protein [Rhodospirillaceae bacterium]|nr:iron-sulfur cluster assembly accessory protein [Rhodospirillaceae bacterium]